MNRIEEMIKRLCPKGVESVKLGDYIILYTGEQLNKANMFKIGSYPVINGGVSASGFVEAYNEQANTITISQGGASAGYVNFIKVPFWAGAHCFVIKPNSDNLNKRFLYHYIKGQEFFIQQCQQGAGIPSVNSDKIKKLLIPLPPLSIQQEIVSVLDSFTTLIDKMKKEVEMRKKQMECYRERLMSPKEGWTVKTLGEIGTFTRGSGLQKSDLRDAGFPCIHYGQIHTFYNFAAYKTKSFCDENYAKKLKKGKTGDLLIATTSEDVEACCKAVAWLGDSEVAYSTDSYCYSHDQDPKFMAYLFQTEMFAKQKRMAATGAKVVRVSGEAMATFSFALPPLSKQREIARTLDIFEEYIQRLEKLISLRQKQYEYYREKLLTFE
jgi:type I restriction enzyme S subunit